MRTHTPIDHYLAAHTLNMQSYVCDKYEKIAQLQHITKIDAVEQGLAIILANTDITFFKMFEDIGFNYDLGYHEVLDEISKVVSFHMEGKEVTFEGTDIFIGNIRLSTENYEEFIPFQSLIIEYILLTISRNRMTDMMKSYRLKDSKYADKKYFTIEEAADFTGYKKSYLYKLKSEGILRAGQKSPGGKLTFKYKDLVDLLFRYETKSIEDLI